MANVAISLATAALPYVVQGVTNWVNKSAQTWGPAVVANNAIETAATAGSNFFGDHHILGKIGGAAGRAMGWMGAPFVAQSATVQAGLGLGGQVAAGAAGALVHVIGGYALAKLAGNQETKEPITEQLIHQQQVLQNQLQLEMLKKLNDQLNEKDQTSHLVVNKKQIKKLAKKMNIETEELILQLQEKDSTHIKSKKN